MRTRPHGPKPAETIRQPANYPHQHLVILAYKLCGTSEGFPKRSYSGMHRAMVDQELTKTKPDQIAAFSSEIKVSANFKAETLKNGLLYRAQRRLVRFIRWGTGDEQPTIDEPFRIARRNLVWAGAGALLLAFADFGADHSAISPLIAAAIPAGALVIAVAFYIGYLLWGFWYEGWRIHQINSSLASEDEEGSVEDKARSVIARSSDQVEQALKAFSAALSPGPGKGNEPGGDARKALNIKASELGSHATALDEILRTTWETLPNDEQAKIQDLATEASQTANDLVGLQDWVATMLKEIPKVPSREGLSEIQRSLDRATSDIQTTQADFGRRVEELVALSNTLHNRARRHLVLYTLGLPMLLGIAALVAPPIAQHEALAALFSHDIVEESAAEAPAILEETATAADTPPVRENPPTTGE